MAPSILNEADSRALLSDIHLGEMCRLTPECAGGEHGRGPLNALPPVQRSGFFSGAHDRDRFCGAPNGYGELSFEASLGSREVIGRSDAWETPWLDLLHLPRPRACLASVVRKGHRGTIPSSGVDGAEGMAEGAFGLTVPMLEMHDVFFGGQFIPFVAIHSLALGVTSGRAFVPLATAEEYGGLVQVRTSAESSVRFLSVTSSAAVQPLQGVAPSREPAQGPVALLPSGQCCFSRLDWANVGARRNNSVIQGGVEYIRTDGDMTRVRLAVRATI